MKFWVGMVPLEFITWNPKVNYECCALVFNLFFNELLLSLNMITLQKLLNL